MSFCFTYISKIWFCFISLKIQRLQSCIVDPEGEVPWWKQLNYLNKPMCDYMPLFNFEIIIPCQKYCENDQPVEPFRSEFTHFIPNSIPIPSFIHEFTPARMSFITIQCKWRYLFFIEYTLLLDIIYSIVFGPSLIFLP